MRLSEACRHAGLTQKQVAHAVAERVGNVSPSTVYRWFAGKSVPSLDEAAVIAELAGVSLDYLAFGRGAQDVGVKLTDEQRRILWLADLVGVEEAARRLAAAGSAGGYSPPLGAVDRTRDPR